jgi:hypothetical protein
VEIGSKRVFQGLGLLLAGSIQQEDRLLGYQLTEGLLAARAVDGLDQFFILDGSNMIKVITEEVK